MKRNILIILTLLLPFFHAGAQYVTYNHDETKMSQVTVMETGAGELTPALFYSVVHNRYYQTAAETNKLRYRSEAAAHGSVQVGISEQVDTSLTRRAEVETLNMADAQVDLAWQAEGPKIQSRLEAFNRNIERLSEAGGNDGDITLWQERYHLFQTAVSAIRNSYMPNAERKKEYLAIWRDITERNNTLIAYIVTVDSRERTKDHLEATLERPDRNAEIAAEARGRWQETSNQTTD